MNAPMQEMVITVSSFWRASANDQNVSAERFGDMCRAQTVAIKKQSTSTGVTFSVTVSSFIGVEGGGSVFLSKA